ncbi:electron transport complex subunit RsxE [Bacillota bacterium LX-D]|nr:electron transport complex subunit RsxE [Bacillota bacterium LX-D]
MSEKQSLWSIFKNGLFESNPIFVLALSLCPALAVTSDLISAMGMGFTVMFVITANNTVISIVRKLVNPKVRLPVYITSIATIVTLAQLLLSAFAPEIYKALSIYLALVVVFAIILARAEVFATKNPVIPSFFDGFGMGWGFLGAMVLIAVIRELFGNGTLAGIHILGSWYNPALIMILPPGGFITIGLLIGLFNLIGQRRAKSS